MHGASDHEGGRALDLNVNLDVIYCSCSGHLPHPPPPGPYF